jgi:hypothetical protein
VYGANKHVAPCQFTSARYLMYRTVPTEAGAPLAILLSLEPKHPHLGRWPPPTFSLHTDFPISPHFRNLPTRIARINPASWRPRTNSTRYLVLYTTQIHQSASSQCSKGFGVLGSDRLLPPLRSSVCQLLSLVPLSCNPTVTVSILSPTLCLLPDTRLRPMSTTCRPRCLEMPHYRYR